MTGTLKVIVTQTVAQAEFMPYARKDLHTWQKGMYYHIYNRGVGKSPIFREPKNYLFVLSKIKE